MKWFISIAIIVLRQLVIPLLLLLISLMCASLVLLPCVVRLFIISILLVICFVWLNSTSLLLLLLLLLLCNPRLLRRRQLVFLSHVVGREEPDAFGIVRHVPEPPTVVLHLHLQHSHQLPLNQRQLIRF